MAGMRLQRNAMAGIGFCLVALLGAIPVAARESKADPWRITPAVGIGKVRLGMTRQAIHALLGSPQSRASQQQGAPEIERWAGSKPSAKSAQLKFKTDFVTVYYRGNRVVQVDASSPAFKLKNGLSTRNSARDFQAHYQPDAFQETDRQYLHDDPAGIPAGKHFVRYEDNKRQGFAVRYGWWGNLAPDGNPSLPLETISVHRSGQAVLIDPNGSDRFTITEAYVQKHGYPGRKAGK